MPVAVEAALTHQELVAALNSDNVETLFSGLSRFNRSLSRLINEDADPQVSVEADLLKSYIKGSPECAELFRLWEFQQANQIDRIAPVLLDVIAHMILSSKLIEMWSTGSAASRSIIRDWMKPIYRNLSSGKRPLIQSTLRLLIAVAGFNSATAKELHETFNFTMQALPKLLHTRQKSPREDVKPRRNEDVRTLYIRFLFAFLEQGDISVKRFMLEAKDILSSVFKGLADDSYETVDYVLSTLRRTVIDDTNLARTLKVAFFNNYILDQLVKLYARKEVDPDNALAIADVGHEFLLYICTTPGVGVCFQDAGWYPAKSTGEGKAITVYNKVLLRLLLSLKPTEDPRQEALVLMGLRNCPELVQPYWNELSSLSFEPRVSSKWIANMALAAKIIQLPIPSRLGATIIAMSPPPLMTMVDNVLPPPLDRALNIRGLLHPNALVKHTSAFVQALALEKLARIQATIESIAEDIVASSAQLAVAVGSVDGLLQKWRKARDDLTDEIKRRLPDFQTVLALQSQQRKQVGEKGKSDEAGATDMEIDGEAAEVEEISQEVLHCISLKLVRHYQRQFPDAILEARFNCGKLLPADLTALSEELQIHILELIGEVPEFNWKERAAHAPTSHLGSIWKLYLTTTSNNVASVANGVLHRLLAESFLFENHIDEIPIWLLTLQNLPKDEQMSALAWLDEALCTGARTLYRTVDRLSKLVHACHGRLSDYQKRVADHVLETRRRTIAAGDEQLVDIPPYPISPALISIADGLQALLRRSAEKGDRSAAIGPAQFFFHLVVRLLQSTQGIAEYLVEVVDGVCEGVIVGGGVQFGYLACWEADHYLHAAKGYFTGLAGQTNDVVHHGKDAAKRWRKTLKAMDADLAASGEVLTMFLKNTCPVDLSTVFFEMIERCQNSPPLLACIADYLTWRHPISQSMFDVYQVLREFAIGGSPNESNEAVVRLFHQVPFCSLLTSTFSSSLDFGPTYEELLISRINSCEHPPECVWWTRQVLLELGRSIHLGWDQHRRFAFALLKALVTKVHSWSLGKAGALVSTSRLKENAYDTVRDIIFGHPLLLDRFVSRQSGDKEISTEIMALVHETLEMETRDMNTVNSSLSPMSPTWRLYTDRVRDRLLAELAFQSPHNDTVRAFELFRSFMTYEDVNQILQPLLNGSENMNDLLFLALTARTLGRDGEPHVIKSSFFRRLLKLLKGRHHAEIENIIANIVKRAVVPQALMIRADQDGVAAFRVIASDGDGDKQYVRLYADVPSLFDENTVRLLLNGEEKDGKCIRAHILRSLIVTSPVIRRCVVDVLNKENRTSSLQLGIVHAVLAGLVVTLSAKERFSMSIAIKVVWEVGVTEDERDLITLLHRRIQKELQEQLVSSILGIDGRTILECDAVLRLLGLFAHEYGGLLDELVRRASAQSKSPNYLLSISSMKEHLLALLALASDPHGLTNVIAVALCVLRWFFVGKKKGILNGSEQPGERDLKEVIEVLESVLVRLEGDENAIRGLLDQGEIFKNFLVAALKYRITDPHVLNFLTHLVTFVYGHRRLKSSTRRKLPFTVDALVEMILSHSQFTVVAHAGTNDFLSTNSKISPIPPIHIAKPCLLHFLHLLMSLDPVHCCKTEHLPLLAQAYQGTVASADQVILAIWELYEKQAGISVEAHAMRWGLTSTAALSSVSAAQSLARIDAVWMAHTCQWFPTALELEAVQPSTGHFAEALAAGEVYSSRLTPLYDPKFFLPLVAGSLIHGSMHVDSRRLVESNALGLAIMALSSDRDSMRKAGYFVLDLSYNLLYESTMKERNQIILLLEGLKNAVVKREEGNQGTQRVPAVVALFIAQGLMILLKPENEMYPLVNRFFLQRPIVDLEDVPMFYGLFYSASDNSRRERVWMLRLLSCGLKTAGDYRLYKRRHVVDILMGFFSSSMSDTMTRKLVLEVIVKATAIPSVISDMITQSGLLTFMHTVVTALDFRSGNDIVLCIPRVMRAILSGFVRSDPEWHGSRRIVWLESIATVVAAVVQGIASAARLDGCIKAETATWWCNVAVDVSRLLYDTLAAFGDEEKLATNGSAVSPFGIGHVLDLAAVLEQCERVLPPDFNQNGTNDQGLNEASNVSLDTLDLDGLYSLDYDLRRLLKRARLYLFDVTSVLSIPRLPSLLGDVRVSWREMLARLLDYTLECTDMYPEIWRSALPDRVTPLDRYTEFLLRLQMTHPDAIAACVLTDESTRRRNILGRLVAMWGLIGTQFSKKARLQASVSMVILAQQLTGHGRKRKRDDDGEITGDRPISAMEQLADKYVPRFAPDLPRTPFSRKLLYEVVPILLGKIPKPDQLLKSNEVGNVVDILQATIRRIWGGDDCDGISREERIWTKALSEITGKSQSL
ncbi:uncharacterized protein SPPG_01275 [Spizellomyces punctatus DAOM BR117]|uniref:Nucleolar pre-ribosomal-associated protein 1 C-terminal domain-containing protein n=1 Tax=Spizellomyces punctatus (strain DAOM BR117) TaxID=645134 RepID=A0A0L0HSH7_SPIPD|nr:uncharacterized protein SPPG_01275 [Spizellomyces punctatus DAOM BR117]KND03819.1 hypothetical protein SPPG_01275 [Spizellomyces punctatus DAOM BR117]|eukprot:XP_016611858.1 hypothetical protein SPPG_01275 [Spizellomyces punctatus DAOM BR117]